MHPGLGTSSRLDTRLHQLCVADHSLIQACDRHLPKGGCNDSQGTKSVTQVEPFDEVSLAAGDIDLIAVVTTTHS